MYYGLSNFYQNHRRYVKSRDDSQLNGHLGSLKVRQVPQGRSVRERSQLQVQPEQLLLFIQGTTCPKMLFKALSAVYC